MKVKDAVGVVHVATSKPGPDAYGDTSAGQTHCGRWWIWRSLEKGFRHYAGSVAVMDYVFTSPTCLVCIGDRRPG